jgi:hypothetical protein
VPDVESAVRALDRIDEIDRSNCRRHFERYFTSTRMAQDYLAIYEEMVIAEPARIRVPHGVTSWTKLTLPSSTT